MRSSFAGTLRLTRLALRRDRVTLPAWILGLGTFVAVTTAMFESSLAAREDLVRETQIVATNAGMRLLGLTSGASVGSYTLHREFVTLAALAALMSTFAVVRHTRQNEELGRAETLGSTVVGRYASLTAAVVVALAADVALAVVLGAAMAVTGQPVGASFLVGASVAAVGVAFVGVAAVTVQLASTTRGASGLAAAVLGAAFLLSGAGNMLGTTDTAGVRVESSWLVWLSPIGWGQQTRPFDDALWWPVALPLLLLVVLLPLALALVGRRDVGRGLWPERPGAAAGARTLLSPAGLLWRLQRGALVGWAVAMLVFGLIFGALSEQMRDAEGSTADYYTRTGGTDRILDAYFTSIAAMVAMFVSIYVVQVLLRMHAEEAGGTLEPELAGAVSRGRWLGAHLLVVGLGALLLILVYSVAVALAAGQTVGGTGTHLRDMLAGGLVQLPALAVVAGAVVAVVATVPHWSTPLSWSLLVVWLALGPMFALDLPQWLLDLSPFVHVPKVPAVGLDIVPLLALVGVAALLTAVGYAGIRRRDLLLPA
jgi:ABC-2 type transport system permease protein